MKAYFLVVAICLTRSSFAIDALDLWSLRYSGDRALQFVTCTGGLFIAGGEGGRFVTSSNGLDWSEQNVDTNILLTAATSDGTSNFVAVGQSTRLGPAVLRSHDGKSWTEQPIAFWDQVGNRSTNLFLFRDLEWPMTVAFAAGSFVMGGYSSQGANLFHSPDLTNWHAAITPPPFFQDGRSYRVLVPAKISGTEVMLAAGSIWVPIRLGTPVNLNSGPGWSFPEVQGSGYTMGGAYGNGMFVLVGHEMATFVSTNGRDWTFPIFGEWVWPNPPTPEYYRMSYMVGDSVAFGNGTFVACSLPEKDILISTNGFWERRVIQIAPGLRSVTYGAGRFVMIGEKTIFASAHISTPGLSLCRQKSGPTRLEVSGQVNREYLLERSPDLITWTEADRFSMPLPKIERLLDIRSPACFYRARLLD
jgi:hypothetical protein